jgi:hypothetical protein
MFLTIQLKALSASMIPTPGTTTAWSPTSPRLHFDSSSAVTRGSIAVKVDFQKFVWLKDTRRLSLNNCPKESVTYQRLAQRIQCNESLPDFLFGSDVCSGSTNEELGQSQAGITYALAKTHPGLYPRDLKGRQRELAIEPYVHHCLVFGKTGRALHQFQSTKDLYQVVCDVLLNSLM